MEWLPFPLLFEFLSFAVTVAEHISFAGPFSSTVASSSSSLPPLSSPRLTLPRSATAGRTETTATASSNAGFATSVLLAQSDRLDGFAQQPDSSAFANVDSNANAGGAPSALRCDLTTATISPAFSQSRSTATDGSGRNADVNLAVAALLDNSMHVFATTTETTAAGSSSPSGEGMFADPSNPTTSRQTASTGADVVGTVGGHDGATTADDTIATNFHHYYNSIFDAGDSVLNLPDFDLPIDFSLGPELASANMNINDMIASSTVTSPNATADWLSMLTNNWPSVAQGASSSTTGTGDSAWNRADGRSAWHLQASAQREALQPLASTRSGITGNRTPTEPSPWVRYNSCGAKCTTSMGYHVFGKSASSELRQNPLVVGIVQFLREIVFLFLKTTPLFAH